MFNELNGNLQQLQTSLTESRQQTEQQRTDFLAQVFHLIPGQNFFPTPIFLRMSGFPVFPDTILT